MWSRLELKERAKAAFSGNYWRCVIVACVMGLLTAGAGVSSRRSVSDEANAVMQNLRNGVMDTKTLVVLGSIVMMLMIAAAVVTMLKLLVFNPLYVGGCSFFLHNTQSRAELRCLGDGFRKRYGRNLLAMFLRELYIALWSMLFVIPGVIKAYSYQLVPYILADDENLSRREAFLLSRKLMDGNKWNAFVLDLSFFGWFLLAAVTANVAGVFYVWPYYQATQAELYRKLRYGGV